MYVQINCIQARAPYNADKAEMAMIPKEKLLLDLKWATRQRLHYIEMMAWYAGVVTRGDVAKAFGLSDPAATKDLKLYGELAPGNLAYHHGVFGFVPTPGFSSVFADLSPAVALPAFAANLAVAGGPYGADRVYGLPTAGLPLPVRLPGRDTLAQITRAIHGRRRLQVVYRSLTGSPAAPRVIEPHTLVDTGSRWHVRAYSVAGGDFRDFVLSRIVEAAMLDVRAESAEEYDEDWVEWVRLALMPHPGLDPDRRASLLVDYGAENDSIEVRVRRALLGYVLQRLGVDTTPDHAMNPQAYQLVVANRDEIEPFAAWAFA